MIGSGAVAAHRYASARGERSTLIAGDSRVQRHYDKPSVPKGVATMNRGGKGQKAPQKTAVSTRLLIERP